MDAFSLQSTLVYRADGVEHLAHVFCLSHRCQITSGKSVRAIFPCAAGAAIAAEATRAAASAASSEDSRNSHKILIYYAYWLFLKDVLCSIYCAIHILHNFEEMWIMKQQRKMESFSTVFILYISTILWISFKEKVRCGHFFHWKKVDIWHWIKNTN